MDVGPAVPCDLDEALRRSFPAGTIERDNVVQGGWYVSPDAKRRGATLLACWIDRAGNAACMSEALRERVDAAASIAAAWAECPRPGPGGAFGGPVLAMDAMARSTAPSRLPDASASASGEPWAASRAGVRRLSALRQELREFGAALGHDLDESYGAEARHVAWMGRSVAPFLARLDPLAIRLARNSRRSLSCDHWAGVDSGMTPGAPLRRAVAGWPAFHNTLMAMWETRDAEADFRDEALPGTLARFMSARWGLRTTLATSLRCAHDAFLGTMQTHEGVAIAGAGPSGVDKLPHLLTLLSDLPANWVPRDAPGWSAYLVATEVGREARSFLPLQGVADRDSLARFLDVGGRWEAWLSRLSKAVGDFGGIDDLAVQADIALTGTLDAQDVPRALAGQVLGPALAKAAGRGSVPHDPGLEAVATSILFAGATLHGVLERSRRWHAGYGLPDLHASATSGFDAAWPAHLPGFQRGDLTLTVLTTPGQLADEGRRGSGKDGRSGLAHCVGGYVGRCRTGAARIASITRTAPGHAPKRVSTVEFVADDGTVVANQHRGQGNGEPADDAVALVRAYLGTLDADHATWEAMDPSDGQHVGYDFSRPGNFEAVVAAWDPFLPRRLRGLDAAGWATVAREASWARLAATENLAAGDGAAIRTGGP